MAKRISKTHLADEVWRVLADVGAARPVQGEWWPKKHAKDGVSYGECVKDAVQGMLATRLTTKQLELLKDVVYWVGASVLRG